jgi:UDP-N-acetylglucosamine--N-acetylmuramyl-(pentapeptide) pyrophosphoryl-undecaprenol N-acetylglucosamine transferase
MFLHIQNMLLDMANEKHILLTGGGTLGPVTPLLAVAAEWRKRDPRVRFTWVGTPNGPEKILVEAAKIPFVSFSAPKFDRARWWTWPAVPFALVWSCVRAFRILTELEPSLMMSAGAFVSVPFAWMGKLFGVPTWIHQLDSIPGLANKLMAPVAKRISVTWEENVAQYGAKKTIVVGGMIRSFLRFGDAVTARELFGLRKDMPTVLVIGGGTGATRMNEMFATIGPDLVRRANVIHVTGRGKMLASLESIGDGYVAREFVGEGMADILAVADLVVCRAGMGTIMELVALGKPAILLPLPGHQEVNAKALEDRGAVEVLRHITPQTLFQAILRYVEHKERRDALTTKIRAVFPTNGDERIVHEAERILEEITSGS